MNVIRTRVASATVRIGLAQSVSSQNLPTDAGSYSVTGSDTLLLDPAGSTNVVNFDVTSATIKTLIVGSMPDEHGFHFEHNHPTTVYPDDTSNVFSGPGDWSDTTKWSQGRLPNDSDDVVHVPAGFPLVFPTGANRTINFVNFLINTDGEVQVDFSGVNDVLTFNGRDVAIDTDLDPQQWGNAFWCLGKLRLTGKTRTPWVEIDDADAGDTVVTVRSAVTNWAVGDTLVFEDCRQMYYQLFVNNYHEEYEVRTISSISGNDITLNSALTYDHHGARTKAGTQVVYTAVMNLTRNIVVKSADKDGARLHSGGHGRCDMEWRYVEFKDTGRSKNAPFDDTTRNQEGTVTHVGTNQRGRYGGVHLHHVTGPVRNASEQADANVWQAVAEGCSSWNEDPTDIADLPRWGLCNVHNSHWCLVKNNVGFNHAGAQIFGESGNERESRIEGNFMIRTLGEASSETTRGPNDVGFTATGMWLRGTDCRVINNRVNRAIRAYIIATLVENPVGIHYPLYKGADTTVVGEYEALNIQEVPIREFRGNVGGGWISRYMELWDVGAGTVAGGPAVGWQRSIVEDCVSWHTYELGFYNYRTVGLRLDNFRGYQDFGRLQNSQGGGIGFFTNDYQAWEIELIDCQFHGFTQGVLVGPLGDHLIQGCHFECHRGIEINPPWIAGSPATILSNRTVTVDACTYTAPGYSLPPEAGVAFDIGKVAFIRASGSNATNLRVVDAVNVTDHDGSVGDNFDLYYLQQEGSASFPETSQWVLACPVAGKTNTQSLADHGVCWGNEIAPGTSTTRSGVAGLINEV